MTRSTPRHWRAAFVVLIVAVVTLVPVAGARAATPTKLAISVTNDSSQVQVSGLLVDNRGRAVVNQAVAVSLANLAASTAATDNAGRFKTSLPVPQLQGLTTLVVTASYEGNQTYGASSDTVRVRHRPEANPTATAPAPAPSEPVVQPTPQPPGQPSGGVVSPTPPTETVPASDTQIQIAPQTGQIRPGDLFAVNGRISAGGLPLQDATVQLSVTGATSPALEATSDGKGEFTLSGQVPENAPAGALAITVIFDGAAGIAAARVEGSITVAAVASPSPTASPGEATPEPAASSGDVGAAAEPEPDLSSVEPTAETAVTNTAAPNALSPTDVRTYALVGLGLVLVLAVGTGIALASRRKSPEEVTTFDRLID